MPKWGSKNMGSEIEGGVLDIHFGNKTDVDLCRISLVEKNTYDHCKKTVSSYPADNLLGYDRRYEHHTYGSNGDPPGSSTFATFTDCTAPTILKIRLGTFYYF
jgi:hypothetical protein